MKKLAAAAVAALVFAPAAFGHAEVTPPIVVKKASNLFALAVPTEKEGLTTTGVELTVPDGFRIDSFVPTAGWERVTQTTGSGEEAVVKSVKWTGGAVPTGEDSVFQFLGAADSAKTYTFSVRQTYSDGSVVNWSGPESSDTPSPTLEVRASLGGGGTNLDVIALVFAAVAIVLALGGFAHRSGRRLA
jgi:uncharacterized protein YcnI